MEDGGEVVVAVGKLTTQVHFLTQVSSLSTTTMSLRVNRSAIPLIHILPATPRCKFMALDSTAGPSNSGGALQVPKGAPGKGGGGGKSNRAPPPFY